MNSVQEEHRWNVKHPPALCCRSCCEVKLTSETPHPGHPCLDSFQVSSHLKIMETLPAFPSGLWQLLFLATHKSAALGCLLKRGSGSKVSEPCPLAPSRQMAPQGFSGCQEQTLRLSLLPTTPLHSRTQLVLSPIVSLTPTLSPWQPHPLSPLTLRAQAQRTLPLLIILSLCRDSTPFLVAERFQYRVNRKGNLSRHWEMAVKPKPNTYSEKWGSAQRALVLPSTNYRILKDFSRFLFLTPTSFPLPPFHFV